MEGGRGGIEHHHHHHHQQQHHFPSIPIALYLTGFFAQWPSFNPHILQRGS
jgi:hypothetical protein